jgi:two-component system chemotaxis sensor kinase CheA
LKKRAVESGAISESDAEGMEPDQALDLIFLPGFSTADEVTQVSGRGVGASAARSAVEQMRGTLSLRSEAGVGTTFIIRLPLTLAIIRGLLFRASGQLFALPLLGVSEIVRAQPSDVTRLDGFENYRLRDRFISLARPGAVLGFERRAGGSGASLRREARFIFIIVLAVGGKKYGVIADEVVAEQELVIKPLDSRWVENEALAGASVLGDGRVVLILDAEMVFRKAVKYERSRGRGKGVYGA